MFPVTPGQRPGQPLDQVSGVRTAPHVDRAGPVLRDRAADQRLRVLACARSSVSEVGPPR